MYHNEFQNFQIWKFYILQNPSRKIKGEFNIVLWNWKGISLISMIN